MRIGRRIEARRPARQPVRRYWELAVRSSTTRPPRLGER